MHNENINTKKNFTSRYDLDDDVTFYYLKNNTLTNCQFEDLGFYGDMGVEFTIQDTYDGIETTMF